MKSFLFLLARKYVNLSNQSKDSYSSKIEVSDAKVNTSQSLENDNVLDAEIKDLGEFIGARGTES